MALGSGTPRTNRVRDLDELLRSIALKYPQDLVAEQLADVKRIAFHIGFVVEQSGVHATVCDIGGGIGLFSLGCAAVGMRSLLVDDFGDAVNIEHGSSVLDLHRSYGVEIVSQDVIANQQLPFPPSTIDVFTTFDSMEHWHHSPKRLFHSVMSALRPGGTFLLGVPNCVNLRKRLVYPLGLARWSPMDLWYDHEVFRGHVREPSVQDLRYIANDMSLVDVQVFGRNWLGYRNRIPQIRTLVGVVDRALQRFPSLCSDIYVAGRKPQDYVEGAV